LRPIIEFVGRCDRYNRATSFVPSMLPFHHTTTNP
jgi:hypothetical protein